MTAVEPAPAPYRPGEVVSVTMRGVVHRCDQVSVTIRVECEGVGVEVGVDEVPVPLDSPTVKVERLAPADWPPQPGDLWRDAHGALWFYQRYESRDDDGRLCFPARFVANDSTLLAGGGYPADDVNWVLQTVGPLELVHREQDGADR